MKLAILVVLLITLLAVPAMAINWIINPANSHSYSRTDSYNLMWTEAEATAIDLGGHLATIRSSTEEEWLKATFGTDWLWIGFNDIQSQGAFVWASSEPVMYTNWNTGEPSYTNGPGGEPEHYVGYNIGASRGWNDFPNWYRLAGIVEITSVPEPSGLLALGGGLAGLIGTVLRKRK